ncbi:peroxisome biogenesis factor 1 isoform X2 [Oryzias melastigma]|uniref:peroxisome biogenesis factor 1 isoform X2 n=1 Tax=Oryzias melastigma TaxID=30732 RepID=UPI000CF7D980|nr:peroxisome biogenesis factor 1 isoform X2 [Oryzias melastigma]
MLNNQGIQPVCVVFNNTKNCFIQLPSKLISHLSLNENQALELSRDGGSTVFLSWCPSRTSSGADGHRVELSRQLGEKLGLTDGEQCFLRPCHQVSSLNQVFVEPLSSDDWEILELHSSALEEQLLNQIRVVFQDAVFPVWVNSQTVIYIRIVSLSPHVPFGHLEQFTELVVTPKIGAGIKSSQNQPFPPRQNPPFSSSSLSSAESSFHVPHSNSPGGIANMKNFLRTLITGTYDSIKELPPVPDIPVFFPDAIYRVCNAPPDSLCTISHIATGVVHIFPWNPSLIVGKSAVTYGLLSKVQSPKEAKEKIKRALEKKNSVPKEQPLSDKRGEDKKREEAMVVRTICHGTEMLTSRERCPSKGEIYCGKVWIPEPLMSEINIRPHSAVRIKPVKSTIKVAIKLRLQPLNATPEEDDEEIQSMFLGWLHTKSHEPLARLTPRSGTILLHGNDAKLEIALTVLKPEPQSDPQDQLFLLSPTVLHKEDIQVNRQPATMPAVNAAAEAPELELPSLHSLGGVGELARVGFEFLSHSFVGNPLSRELGTAGRGLQGGALLITGAKGSGKSTLSRGLCRKAREDLDSHVEVVDCKKLQGKKVETVRQIFQDVFEQAEWRQPSVVLLDDLDYLARAPTSPEHDGGPEALLHAHIAQTLRDVVDEVVVRSSLVCLIITSMSEQSLHPSLTEVQGSHFIQGFVNIQPPDQAQRAAILRHLILRKPLFSEETLSTLNLTAVAKETEGYTAQDLNVLLERATHANTTRTGRRDRETHLTLTDFEQALKGFVPPSLWGVDLHVPSGVGLERVGGLKEVRQQLMDTILLPAKFPILFSNLPIRHRSGILLYGAPGTGKTLMARAVAKDSGMNFISIKGPELLSKYIGASEQAVRDVFQRAQAASPCILFFDEFDSLAPRRGHDSTGVTDRVVNQLLTQLDGVEGLQGVYVLAATSRPDLIDPALLRPGRLDKCLYCPPPDLEARVEILKALSSGLPLAPNVDLEQLAAATEQFTGADLKALLYNAQLEAVHTSAGPGAPQETTPVSDSDMSLSSMIFLNNSSGSDDSVGEGDQGAGSDLSMVLVESSELRAEDQEDDNNLWRLYFGSSYESELGNSPISRLCVSGPSVTQDCPGGTLCEPACILPPAYMSSIQTGYEELSLEELDHLQQKINNIKSSYKRANESVRTDLSSSQPSLLVSPAHLNAALAVTKASLSQTDWKKYTKLYEDFNGSADGKVPSSVAFKPGQRATLA